MENNDWKKEILDQVEQIERGVTVIVVTVLVLVGILILTLIFSISTAHAADIQPGYGATVTCTASSELPQDGQIHPGQCRDDQDVWKRLYNLEVAVQKLQAENAALKTAGASVASQATDARIPALEQRITFLESQVLPVLKSIAALLLRLAK